MSKTDSAGTTSYKRAGATVTDSLLKSTVSSTTTDYTPGVSSREGSDSAFLHSGIKNADTQTDDGGDVSAMRRYDAFGHPLSSSGTWAGPFGYGGPYGYQTDPDHGLMLLGHRYYEADTGRFLTRDPIKDGRNWYGYCDGNPIGWLDPLGLKRYAGYASGPDNGVSDTNSFRNRARRGGKDGSFGFGTSEELFDKLKRLKDITRLDLHAHGSTDGIHTGTTGDRVTRGRPGLGSSKSGLQTIADLIIDGSIDMEKGAVIRLFPCHQYEFAFQLSQQLAAGGRGDITVIGADKNVYPIVKGQKESKAAVDRGSFYFFRNGRRVDKASGMNYE